MSRLTCEFSRLYPPATETPAGPGLLRALVLELARPAEWRPLAAVWLGVQADLGLPAPAIAVNGADGLQLWFSLAEPLEPERADEFLEALCRRYLSGVARTRLGRATALMPAQREASGCWSAFVAPDLAALFEETPWLDLPPNDDGQADLLASLHSIKPQQFETAMTQLQKVAPALAVRPEAQPASAVRAPAGPEGSEQAARAFLLSVMNDAAAPLALRIEAARALLPGAGAGLG